MRVQTGAANAVLDHPAEVVRLVPVDEGVVDADIRQSTAHQQSVDLQPTQKDLKISAEKGGIASFGDDVVGWQVAHLDLGNLCLGVVLQAVNVFVSV